MQIMHYILFCSKNDISSILWIPSSTDVKEIDKYVNNKHSHFYSSIKGLTFTKFTIFYVFIVKLLLLRSEYFFRRFVTWFITILLRNCLYNLHVLIRDYNRLSLFIVIIVTFFDICTLFIFCSGVSPSKGTSPVIISYIVQPNE